MFPHPAVRSFLRAGALGLMIAALLAAVPSAAARAQSDPVVARVAGVDIHESDLAMASQALGNEGQHLVNDYLREQVGIYVADTILAARSAEGLQIAEQRGLRSRVSFYRNKLVLDALLAQKAKAALTDAALKEAYAEAIKEMSDDPEVRARHILVSTEAEAKAVLAEIEKGADFTELAKQKSKDRNSADDGGDLGYFVKKDMLPEFGQAAVRLEKGQVSDPVKTQVGWHIIKLDDKRPMPLPTFESIKGALEEQLERKAEADYLAKLREGSKVEWLDQK